MKIVKVHSSLVFVRVAAAAATLCCAAFTYSVQAPAADGYLYQAAYRLKMSSKETQTYRDYFASLGSRQGIQVGDVLEVVRAMPAVNALWGGVSPLIEIVLGEVQVLAVSPSGSVVRMIREASPEHVPVMQYTHFMIGDQVRSKITFAKEDGPSLE